METLGYVPHIASCIAIACALVSRPQMLNSDTKRRIGACRDVFVGKLPPPTNQVELITLAPIYKFMDNFDEESVAVGGKRPFFTGWAGHRAGTCFKVCFYWQLKPSDSDLMKTVRVL